MRMSDADFDRAVYLLVMHWTTGLLLEEEQVRLLVRSRLSRREDWVESRPGRYRDGRVYLGDEGTWAQIHELTAGFRPGIPEGGPLPPFP
ncbi:MAG: hypothetical protein ACYC63_20215 [Armatimonadota bacterium]